MLVGRERELEHLEAVVACARRGRGASLVVRGEPGVGKTALLAAVADRAEGVTALSARGTESEGRLAFAGVASLARPLFDLIDQLPAPQQRSLGIALALVDGRIHSPHQAYLGLLTLFGVAAERQPLLVVVDDLQWLDRESTRALLFVARRVQSDHVAILLATRAGEDDELDLHDLPSLTIRGLPLDAATELLRVRYPDIGPDVRRALAVATDGLPLALEEIPALLSPAQRRGDEPLPDPLPVGRNLRDAYRRSLGRVPASSLDGLLVVAATAGGSSGVVDRTLARLGVAVGALAAAEAEGLIRSDGTSYVFRHPVLRATIYGGATASARRRVHAALADALDGSAPEARAWHLAAAARGEDDAAADALEQAAASAARRGGHDAAALALERAASLTGVPADRARRLVAGADACRLGGMGTLGLGLLDRALRDSTDRLMRADIQLLRGRLLYLYGSVDEAHELLAAEADNIELEAPDRAAVMLTEATWACTAAAEVPLALRSAARAHALATPIGGATEVAAALAHAEALLLSGNMDDAWAILRQCRPALERSGGGVTPPFSPTSAMTFLVAEDYEVARSLMNRQVAAARELAAPGLLAFVLASRAEYWFRVGQWATAHADAVEAVELGNDHGWSSVRPFALITLARVEAGLGDPGSVEHADAGERLVARSGCRSLIMAAQSARALFYLGAGRPHDAIAELEQTAILWQRSGCQHPSVVQWMPDLIEAYVHAGRPDDAARSLAVLVRDAERTGSTWARAAAARCEGLLDPVGGERAFHMSLALLAGSPTPFEEARTQLGFGERLRRGGRRADARPNLRAALETFERIGAAGWAHRARTEIGGSVEHRQTEPSAIRTLSPQELQVALQVAGGATNLEAAASLFVSRKTVEFHLRNVYRKLDIRSRTDLARVMAENEPTVPSQLRAN